MIIILGLAILVVAVAGVLANSGSAHAVGHFSVLGYHLTGSADTLCLSGIVVGAAHLPAWQRRPPRAHAVPPRDRSGRPGTRRPDRPA